MVELLSIIGVFVAIEGALYAAAPNWCKRVAAEVLEADPGLLRGTGLVFLCAGVLLVWLVRG